MPLLCLSSPKGGVGKTTLAANLAWVFGSQGARVVALDLDPQNALRLHFGVSLHDGAGLMPVLRRRGAWQSALRPVGAGIWLLPYGQADMPTALSDGTMIAGGALAPVLLGALTDPATIVVVDTPPGPSAALGAARARADLLLTVLLADASSVALLPAMDDARAAASPGGAARRRHGFVLNQVNAQSRLSRATAEGVRRHLGDRLLGMVSRDECVAEAIASQQPVIGFAPASRATQDIARLAATVARQLGDAAAGRAMIGMPMPPAATARRAW